MTGAVKCVSNWQGKLSTIEILLKPGSFAALEEVSVPELELSGGVVGVAKVVDGFSFEVDESSGQSLPDANAVRMSPMNCPVDSNGFSAEVVKYFND